MGFPIEDRIFCPFLYENKSSFRSAVCGTVWVNKKILKLLVDEMPNAPKRVVSKVVCLISSPRTRGKYKIFTLFLDDFLFKWVETTN